MDTNNWRFLSGCVGGKEPQHLFCATEFAADADAGCDNSTFHVYHKGQWYSYNASPEWTAISMAAAPYSNDLRWVVVAISMAGDVWELYPLERAEMQSRISTRTDLTNLATIGNEVYACGMGRIVHKRDERGNWNDISAPWPEYSEGVIGFTAMAGLTTSEIVAVGWQGEIWSWSSGTWVKEDSPTIANLNAVTVDRAGVFYAVGDGGVLLRGRRDQWEVLNSGTEFDLMDVVSYEDQIFACSNYQVFRLAESGLVYTFDDDAEDAPASSLKLVSGAGSGLFSIGSSDVFLLADQRWTRLA